IARRLKDLRVDSFDKPVTQSTLASALGVTPQSISSWERKDEVTVIPIRHLRSYARFFAVDRSGDGSKRPLLEVSEMTDDERHRAAELEFELEDLRSAALGEGGVRHEVEPVVAE